ncbi:MAG TPA: hydrogenase iron-sulfur subunit [Anaerolineales bacterium]|nr:hydrogenase iron-sulfur subunit [Anaerolineales bacterium]
MGELSFEPRIIALCCHYCAYAAADLAGALRLQYPDSIHVVKIPCTGDLDVRDVLAAFESGADGVMVAGCMEGDCHYQTGNVRARKRVERTQQVLAEAGVGGERIRMVNLSSAMGGRWAEVAREMDAHIRQLGPSPLRRTAQHSAGER